MGAETVEKLGLALGSVGVIPMAPGMKRIRNFHWHGNRLSMTQASPIFQKLAEDWLLKRGWKLTWGEEHIELVSPLGPPCSHTGCHCHVTHPCEGCGRTEGRYRVKHADPVHAFWVAVTIEAAQ